MWKNTRLIAITFRVKTILPAFSRRTRAEELFESDCAAFLCYFILCLRLVLFFCSMDLK